MGHQLPVYYVSKELLAAETRYPDMEKVALSFVTISRKLRLYFYAHIIYKYSPNPPSKKSYRSLMPLGD